MQSSLIQRELVVVSQSPNGWEIADDGTGLALLVSQGHSLKSGMGRKQTLAR